MSHPARALCLLLLSLRLAGAAAAQSPVDTAHLSATLRNPTLPDTLRLRAGLALAENMGTDSASQARHRQLLLRLLPWARRIGAAWAEVRALQELVLVADQTDDQTGQLLYGRQGIARARQLRQWAALVGFYHSLGGTYFEQQRIEEARRYLELAVAVMRQHPVPATTEATLMGLLSNTYLELGQAEPARRTFRRALALSRTLLNPLYEFQVLSAYANGLRLNQPDSAAHYLLPALAIARRLQDPYALAYANMVLMQTRKAQGQWPQVRLLARQAARYARLSDTPSYEAEALAGLAASLRHLGQGAAAYDTLIQAQVLIDTLQAQDAEHELSVLQVRFGTERQQARIRSLEQSRRLAAQTQELTRLRHRQQLIGLGGLVALALLLGGALLWRYRRRLARQRAADEAALRHQIAADLHDDVGSLLTQVSLQSELLSQGVYTADQQPHLLQHMADTSRNAVRHMSDVVWGLSQLGLAPTLGPLLDRMHDHAHEVLPPASLELNFQADPALRQLAVPTAQQQALFLIYKEALHNATKHAKGATELRVSLHCQPGGRTLHLDVRDNGAAPLPAPPATAPGHGLRNMQARAQAVAGRVAYVRHEQGFEVQVQLPLG